MAPDSPSAQNNALARATSLVARARKLRGAQAEVQEMTAREVQVMARTAASFFDAVPLMEFTPTLIPPTARAARRTRHRILHRTVQQIDASILIRALLLGRDGALRLFTARSSAGADIVRLLEPGGMASGTVIRDVVDWSPTMRVPGFRPFEILEKLSTSLDVVDAHLAAAEERVEMQKAALASGDLSALLPPPRTPTPPSSPVTADAEALLVAAPTDAPAPEPVDDVIANPVTDPEEPYLLAELDEVSEAEMEAAMIAAFGDPALVDAAPEEAPRAAEDLFRTVQHVAAAVPHAASDTPSLLSRIPLDAEPMEWDDPI